MNRYDPHDDTSYCLGMSLTIEALKHIPEQIKEVILSSKASRNEQLSFLLESCREKQIPYRYDDHAIARLSLKENCYCIGIFNKFYRPLSSERHILLYGFNDYGELGTILRSAICFDLKDIVLIDSCLDFFAPACIRASMGSIFQSNIVRYDDLDTYLNDHQDQHLYPFVSHSERKLSEIQPEEPYAIIIPQDYYGLDDIFRDGYCLDPEIKKEISLSVRSSIILAEIYHLNLSR